MKRSAGIASLLLLLFFLSFNSLQVYLIFERIEETKNKYGFACSDALLSTLLEYNKRKGVDSASLPGHALIAYAPKKIGVNRIDTQTVQLSAPLASLVTDTVDRSFIETVLNSPAFRTMDLQLFDKLFQKGLRSKNINAEYRLDTITIQSRRTERGLMQAMWTQKRNEEYAYAIRPVRIPQYAGYAIFAQLTYDQAFLRNDLLWPMIAFAFILLIGDTALVFVYKTIRRQKRINELKTDFINNITHEMKTPITIASAGLQALEHHVPQGERTTFYLQTSKKQLHLLNDFVERILDAAVQDISDLTLKKEKIDVHALFGELIQSHSVLHRKPVNFQLTGESPVYIDGDRLHLETTFHNIIDNAIKYSNGSVNIHIDIGENNRDCIIKIRDDGKGIPPQFIKNIFEKFFRVPQGDAQPIKGFGLGLHYVNSIVKKHSGHITVHSKWQSGTEFIITLPKYL